MLRSTRVRRIGGSRTTLKVRPSQFDERLCPRDHAYAACLPFLRSELALRVVAKVRPRTRTPQRRERRRWPLAAPERFRKARPAARGWTPTPWNSAATSRRSAVGDTNLQLRVDGLTGICTNDVRQNQATTIGAEIKSIADAGPDPVPAGTALPATSDPADPHQCLQRMNAQEAATDAPADCVAMGF